MGGEEPALKMQWQLLRHLFLWVLPKGNPKKILNCLCRDHVIREFTTDGDPIIIYGKGGAWEGLGDPVAAFAASFFVGGPQGGPTFFCVCFSTVRLHVHAL